jgi:cytochrome c
MNAGRAAEPFRAAPVDRRSAARLNGMGDEDDGTSARKYRMMKKLISIASMAALSIAASADVTLAQDITAGQHSFNKCLPCHAIGPDAENKIGPQLNGLDGRHSGTAPNYSYSDANKKSGIVWGEATFKEYIKNPSALVPDTKMTFAGIKNDQEINDLWAYVKQFDADGDIKK